MPLYSALIRSCSARRNHGTHPSRRISRRSCAVAFGHQRQGTRSAERSRLRSRLAEPDDGRLASDGEPNYAASRKCRSAAPAPGFVLAYVLEGEVVAKITGSPEATYGPGQMFYEYPGSTHEVSRNASGTKPAKFLAFIFAKKGLPLTSPA